MKKRLYRVEQGKMVCGVCGGIGEYFDIDPTLVRLAFVFLALPGMGTGLLAYIICSIVIPKKSNVTF